MLENALFKKALKLFGGGEWSINER